MNRTPMEQIDISSEELERLLTRVKEVLTEEEYKRLAAAIHTLSYVTELLRDKETTLQALRRLLCHMSTEKTEQVLKQAGLEPTAKPSMTDTPARKKVAGHGRNAAAAYQHAPKVRVPHAQLKPGDGCPDCCKGKVYRQQDARTLVRVVGQAPLQATVYELEELRCNACGQLYVAQEPEGVGPEKYDETAAAMIAQCKYGSGVPFNRLEKLEASLGIPLPASTQWDIVEETAEVSKPAYEELIRQAAQGEVLYNDDTGMRVLRLTRAPSDSRTGVFTSGIVSTSEGHKIALYFTGRQHAGENIADVLRYRAGGLSNPIQMCDALSRNVPKLSGGVELLIAKCLAHGRRQFVEITSSFPQECQYVLEMLGQVYGYDAECRDLKMRPEERLALHQQRSGPVMEELHRWLEAQLAEKKTEPNSGLGKAISYLLRHWHGLTAFLRDGKAPLDNSLCERALKRAVLHRKNSLYYRTLNGAQVGDLFMSIIHTCDLCHANSFEYLVEIQRHSAEVRIRPSQWMPWNYREQLSAAT